MKRRRKFRQQRSKQISLLPPRQKRFSKKQRQRFRRQQRRMKMSARSSSTITQITTDAFDMLHISTESNTKPLEFIERYELTRQQALAMPFDQRPVLFLIEQKNSRVFPNDTNESYDTMDESYYSSFV